MRTIWFDAEIACLNVGVAMIDQNTCVLQFSREWPTLALLTTATCGCALETYGSQNA